MAQLVHHNDLERFAGDDWSIVCGLLDDDSSPLDLTGADNIQWMLLGPDGLPAIPQLSATIVVADDPTTGMVTVKLPHVVTVDLGPGRYLDALRVILTGLRQTTVYGTILVNANRFAAVDTPLSLAPKVFALGLSLGKPRP
jgi:hypothetical protein